MPLPIQRCFFIFSLRQGTMLIAVVQLLLSAIGLFLLLLGSAHAQEMATMLEADIEDSAQREGIVLSSEDSGLFGSEVMINSFNQNDIRLHKAQHLAIVVIITLYTGVAMTTVLLFSCILLLYGAIMHVRQLLVPWISVVLLGLVFCCTAMLVSMFLAHGTRAFIILVVGSLHLALGFYLWLVVYSHYRELCEFDRVTCSTSHHTLKLGYLHFPDSV
ncbi:uncharacterized protein LOC129001093 [Macrosteles quadrilineatus]|uniref:uncharacterized protein LOC129000777 n=1 Tax=Macrosteles quadrilineatus TaxID=74068 RepID=UPI0023E21EBF|nr:uncharacterized protein LOC129000777 [Macrosteles quadrilineatus]XP_054284238.1 uncharacterized protein LOC129001093 [Macrosteles quadrilineatus]